MAIEVPPTFIGSSELDLSAGKREARQEVGRAIPEDGQSVGHWPNVMIGL